jgi:hypothetical protein
VTFDIAMSFIALVFLIVVAFVSILIEVQAESTKE